jgi:Tfp pilus tip-associated adhesin PilY1
LLQQRTVESAELDKNFFTVTLPSGDTQKVRVITANPVDYKTTSENSSNVCAVDGLGMVPCDLNGVGTLPDPSGNAGWYYDLPLAGERVVSDALLRQGRVIFVPYTPLATPCGAGGDSVIMELDACSGARPSQPVFDINGDGVIDEHDMIEISPGVFVPAVGIQSAGRLQPPAILKTDKDKEKKYFSSSRGKIVTVTEKGVTLGITYWMEIE